MFQEKLKRNIKPQYKSFIILFYCSIVITGKNTKNSKKYSSLGTATQKCLGKNLVDQIHLVF